MSHKSTISLKINDRESLCQALDIMGVKYQVAEQINGLKITSGYNVQADVDVLLLNDSNGRNMKAVGFKRNEDGTYEAVGDFYEISSARTKDGESLNQISFKDAISKRYAYAKAIKQLSQIGLTVTEDVQNFNQAELNFVMSSSY